MEQLSDKLKKRIEEENTLLEQSMNNAREAHWQNRVVENLKRIETLEDRVAELEAQLSTEEVHNITDKEAN